MVEKINQGRILFFLYFFSILVFIVHFILIGKAIYGDGRYYYSYLPGIIVNHSLNLTEPFKELGITSFLTPNNYPANIYPIGPSIIWLIPFLLVHLLLWPFGLNTGYGAFYEITVGIWNISLVFLGLYFLKNTLEKFTSKKNTLLTTTTIFLATNLLFYASVDVINSHSLSFFISSLFLYHWLKDKSKKTSLFLGSLLGLLALIRPQDAIFIILPLSSLILLQKKYFLQFFILTFTFLIVFFPQVLLWKITWGSWYVNPYLHVEGFNFLSPNVLSVLLTKTNGLFLWTPVTFLSLAGIILFTIKKRKLGIPILLVFAFELYIVSSWSIWWQGASFSGRMFISSLPLLAIGLSKIFELRFFSNKKYLISIFFSLVNLFLIIYFLLNN